MNMRVSQNAALKQPSHTSLDSKKNQGSANSSSNLFDQANQAREDSTSDALADSVQERAQADPDAFRASLEQAYGDKASPAQLDKMASMAANGNLPLPQNVRFVDAGSLGATAMGAYDSANGGTIYLDKRLLNDPKALEAVYTEELGHHLDAELGGPDAAGDEGAIFSQSFLHGKVDATELQALKSENDSGFITIDNKEVAVEFNGYSGPGSSSATGGSSSSSSSSSSSDSSSSSSSSSDSSSSSSSSSDNSSSRSSSSDSSSSDSSSSRSSSSDSSSSGSSYSGPGSSSATGGSDNTTSRSSSNSSSSGSSYAGPGSPGAGGSDDSSTSSNNSSSGSSSTNPSSGSSSTTSRTTPSSTNTTPTTVYDSPPPVYSGPGSSVGTGGLPTEEPETVFNLEARTTVYRDDLLERNTASGGTTQALSRDFVYSPSEGRFVREYDSTQFAPNENTIGINGGASDEFRYNNSSSQTPEMPIDANYGPVDVSIGDSFGTANTYGYEDEISGGSESAGYSADVDAGIVTSGQVGYGYDGDTFEATAGGEVFAGVQGNAEGHVAAGPLAAGVNFEARAGASASLNGGLTFDPRNGVSAEAGGEAFAGVQATVEGTVSLGDSVDAGAGVDFKAGIGVEARAEVDFGLDNVGVDLELGAALGLGADVKVDISISPSGIVDDVGDMIEGAGDAVDNVRDFFSW